ncbi:hypothetical protein [Deinococcus sp. 12RED42]|uniref:hypothetical protein n=1 Tax=Deinococcus sp. 12RED42 TaxID=2745872 RepID=UPI001E438BC3|nr:hypothetical protein [Deinococcus sp. 12RED42]MCD0164724.1 hypothetical protein [Deinococcus sp. 12RED42]
MTHPHDHLAQKITHALQDHDADILIATLHDAHLIRGSRAQLTSNLRPILTAALRDHINLLHPPPDFHSWLTRIVATNIKGTPSRPNTRNSRVIALRTLYRALRQLNLITGDPLLDYVSLPAERRDDPLPTAADLDRLLHAARQDPALHAALLLLWHHALQLSDLLRLRWPAYTPTDGTLLRGELITHLTPQAEAALTRLHHRAGHHPLYPDTHGSTDHLRIFPYDTPDALRLRLRQVTRDLNLPFTPPGLIRRCALRDHPSTAHQLGYTRDKDYQKALKHAQQIAARDR